MSAIILDDEIVHYEVLGRGKPVIFLHGWVGSWRYWIPAMQAASVEFRAYAIDLWGFGDTAKDPNRYLLNAQRNMLDNFLDEMGIGKIAIIGHGLGAVVGMMFAEQYPKFVDRILAIGMPLETKLINNRMQQTAPEDLAEWLLGATPEAQAARIEAPKADQNAILRTIDNLESIQLTAFPDRLQTPCLLVNGENDPAILKAPSEKLDALPEHFHHISFADSGHFPMLDHPGRFNRLMKDFLSLESGESPKNLQLKEEWKRRLR